MRWPLAALLLAAACSGTNPYEAKVEEVLLADCDKVQPAPPGPLVKLTLEQLEPALPEVAPGGAIRVAVDRKVPWQVVQELLAKVEAKGATPVLLVGNRNDVFTFVLSEELAGPAIQLTPTPDGKFCVGPPTSEEARCVQNRDRDHINRAFVREQVRDASAAYHLTDVDVLLTPDLEWADVVRTIDGARTCCGTTVIRVGLHEG